LVFRRGAVRLVVGVSHRCLSFESGRVSGGRATLQVYQFEGDVSMISGTFVDKTVTKWPKKADYSRPTVSGVSRYLCGVVLWAGPDPTIPWAATDRPAARATPLFVIAKRSPPTPSSCEVAGSAWLL